MTPLKMYLEYADRLDAHREEEYEPYSTSVTYLCSACLADSDYFCELQGKTPQAYRDRYEFRDGAAIMFSYVFGIDIDYARSLMMTHQAWDDYEQAVEREKKLAQEAKEQV